MYVFHILLNKAPLHAEYSETKIHVRKLVE